MSKSNLAVSLCPWGSPPSGGVVPAALSQMVYKRRALGCCSPAVPDVEPEVRLGEVRFVAPHDRGGDCFDRIPELHGATSQLKF
jgi:hypothetical protein